MTERYTHALDDDWCIIADKFEKTFYQDKDDSDNKSEGEGLETGTTLKAVEETATFGRRDGE